MKRKSRTRADIKLNVTFEDCPLVKRDYNNIEETIASLKELKKKLGGSK